MDNQQKKSILTIVGLGLSIAGAVVGFVSTKVDNEIQTEKIDLAVDKKISSLDFSNMETNHVN